MFKTLIVFVFIGFPLFSHPGAVEPSQDTQSMISGGACCSWVGDQGHCFKGC